MLKNFIYVVVLFLMGYIPAYMGAKPQVQRLMGPRYVAAFLLVVLAGLLSPNIWIYHAVVVATFVATVRDRQEAVCRYISMIALMPAVSTVVVVGPIYLGTFQAAAVLTVAAIIALAIVPGRDRVQPLRRLSVEDGIVVVLYLAFSIGATRFPSATAPLRAMIEGAFNLLLPYYVTRKYIRTGDDVRLSLGCVAIAAASLAVIAVYEARFGWALFDAITSRLSMIYGLAAATLRRGNALRAMGPTGNPLVFAYFFLLGFLAWACSRNLFRNDLIWRGGLFLLLMGVVAPQSRGLFVALVPALIVLFVTRRRFAAAAGLMAAAGLGFGLLVALQGRSSAIDAFIGLKRTGEFYDYRGLLLSRGLEEGWKHPILGQSMEKVVAALVDITQGDHIVDFVNTYLTIFLESGLLGLIVFVVLAVAALRKLVARAKRGDQLAVTRSNRAFLLSALTGTYIYLYSMSFYERVPVYLVVLLAMSRLTSADLMRGATRPLSRPPADPPTDRSSFPERLVPA